MNNIRSERTRLGLTQKALALRLDVDDQTVRRWEKEKSPIPSSKATEMSCLFGCSTDYLFGLSDERKTVA